MKYQHCQLLVAIARALSNLSQNPSRHNSPTI